MKIKNINVKIPYYDEGMKNPFEWYKKGWFKRYYRKRIIKLRLKEHEG